MARLLILSDTHVPDFARQLPVWVLRLATGADFVVHAGDATQAAVLDQLAEHAPVVSVLGNVDHHDVAAWGATPIAALDVGGVAVAVIHDAGPRAGREARLRRRFPEADVAVFGHSHIPELRQAGGVWFINPGSPTWKRREPGPTVVVAEAKHGRFRPRLVEGGRAKGLS
jgi:putative phosphoesterase